MTLHLLTQKEFESMQQRDRYFCNRWPYYSKVIDWLRELRFDSVLELGPYKLPVVAGGHTMDKRRHVSPTYLHDATEIPWPVPDRRYDLFIALQVWEHLGGTQCLAFDEVTRIADHAILSFPLRWHCPHNRTHHNITEERIAFWTRHTTPVRHTVVRSGRLDRIIYQFDFTPLRDR